jgi:hypothetical protein
LTSCGKAGLNVLAGIKQHCFVVAINRLSVAVRQVCACLLVLSSTDCRGDNCACVDQPTCVVSLGIALGVVRQSCGRSRFGLSVGLDLARFAMLALCAQRLPMRVKCPWFHCVAKYYLLTPIMVARSWLAGSVAKQLYRRKGVLRSVDILVQGAVE